MILENIRKNLLFCALFCLALWVLFCASFSVFSDKSTLFRIGCLSLFFLTLARPLWGVGAFLICMPFFGGSRPNDLHTARFYILLSTLVFACGLNLFAILIRAGKILRFDFSHPLVFALLVYWIAAAFSLVNVQSNDVVYSIIQFKPPLVWQFITLGESSSGYSWLAFYVLTISMLLGLIIVNLTPNPHQAFQLMGCFLFGLMLTVFLGLLDYYDVINLNRIRPYYFLEFFGENYRFQHLTSVFGNPGWYAQYLVLGAPALMTILALPLEKKWKIFSLICLMVITEFCIVLIYQRGGWLSYPLTLIIIWFCVYMLNRDQNNYFSQLRALKGSMLKIVITLPLTIVISLSLVFLTAQVQPQSRQQLSGFADRAESIMNVNDRIRYFEPAFLIARLHPIFGPGLESFAHQYEKLYVAPGHLYKQTPKYDVYPYYGSSHNLYFQALAGKGVLGLLSVFGVFFASITLVWRGIFSFKPNGEGGTLSYRQRILLMMTLAYTCALAIYGNVGEIFYSPIGYILFALFYSISVGAVPATYKLSKNFRYTILALLAFALVLHVLLEFHFLNFSLV